MVNSDWLAWTKASFAVYIKALADTLEFAFTLDAMESAAAQTESNYLNLRVQADMNSIVGGQGRISVVIDIIMHYMKDTDDIYEVERTKGAIVYALEQCIPLIDDQSTILGSFQLLRVPKPIRVFDLMNKDQTSRVAETVFTAPFEITL
jgi:hypothetical protein